MVGVNCRPAVIYALVNWAWYRTEGDNTTNNKPIDNPDIANTRSWHNVVNTRVTRVHDIARHYPTKHAPLKTNHTFCFYFYFAKKNIRMCSLNWIEIHFACKKPFRVSRRPGERENSFHRASEVAHSKSPTGKCKYIGDLLFRRKLNPETLLHILCNASFQTRPEAV